jgi:hypothetical protein
MPSTGGPARSSGGWPGATPATPTAWPCPDTLSSLIDTATTAASAVVAATASTSRRMTDHGPDTVRACRFTGKSRPAKPSGAARMPANSNACITDLHC